MSYKLTNYIIKNANIKEEDKEIYEYGIKSTIAMFCNTMAFLLIGVMFDLFLEGIIFTILFMMLRVYAGGVHLSSSIKCFIISSITFIITLLIIKYTIMDKTQILILTILTSVIIWFLAPVEDKNKKLDELEHKVYRKRARIILGLDILLIIVFLLNSFVKYAYLVSILLDEMAIIMILGTINNTLKRESTNSI